MTEQEIDKFFEDYLNKESIFLNKKLLQSNFTPENIPHREEQIKTIADIIAPALRLEKPSNIFVYGKTGTGKTVTIRFVTEKVKRLSEKNKIPISVFYLNCKLKKVADTEYRLMAQLIRELGKEVPSTGLPTEDVYRMLFSTLDEKNQVILLILDEIDQLIDKTGDEILYNLTRINSELKKAQLSVIGISNNLLFKDNIDPRVKSSLSEEEMLFPPYNALQIQDILRERASKAFRKDSVQQGVIEKCAAYAAREHGDARRALELMRIAGELAERSNKEQIILEHIDEAEEKIEKDRLLNVVTTQPKQQQAVLYSILSINEKGKKGSSIFTGEIYEIYNFLCKEIGLRPLTQRRISDIISELDMLGILQAKIFSKGRYGKRREIEIAIPEVQIPKVKKILGEAIGLSN